MFLDYVREKMTKDCPANLAADAGFWGIPWGADSEGVGRWEELGRIGRFKGAGSLFGQAEGKLSTTADLNGSAGGGAYSMRLAVQHPVEGFDGRDDSVQATGRQDLPWLSGTSQSRIKRARLRRHPGMVGSQRSD